jgi:superoxide dismutase, Cu-Zn family
VNHKIWIAALLLSSCASAFAATAKSATTTLSDSAGKAVGTAKIRSNGSDLVVTIKVKGVVEGVHGIHIHSVGLCEAPAFKTAGGHWNPTMKQHGRDNPMGAHEGDLPNLTIGATGKGSLTFKVPAASLIGENGLLDADGAALVIHAKPDDYRTDPSGNSGDRIACGVFAAK